MNGTSREVSPLVLAPIAFAVVASVLALVLVALVVASYVGDVLAARALRTSDQRANALAYANASATHIDHVTSAARPLALANA